MEIFTRMHLFNGVQNKLTLKLEAIQWIMKYYQEKN